MYFRVTLPPSLLSRLAFAVVVGLIANPALAQTIKGTATYRERMALPPAAVFEATIEDVSRADAPASVVARTRITSPGNPPMMLRRVSGTQTAPGTGTPGTNVKPALDGTSWRATELAGKPAPPPSEKREATLVFQTGGRVSGFDGCNTLTGGYTLKDNDGISFGQMGATQKACLDSLETERGFRAALKSASRWRIDGGRLELFDATGARVAAFAARSQASPPNAKALEGTRWQLVRFQGGDGTTLTPDDRGKYTIEFAAGGRLNTRVDCNRGRGSWKSNGPQIELDPLALSRAKCPPGSLHDQIVKQWTFIRSYVMKDGHLFLALMADGGIYEFEPLAATAQTAAPQTPPQP